MCESKTKKQSMISLIFLIIISAGGFAASNDDGATEEKTPEFTYGSEMDFNFRYLWRGVICSEGVVAQPSVWVSFGDFTSTVWSNLFFDDGNSRVGCNEFDFILAYNRELAGLIIEPSFSYYLYCNQEDAPATGEIAFKLSYPAGLFAAFTDHAFDIVRYTGSYFGDFGFSYEHEFNSKLLLDAALSFAWASAKFNDTYIGVSKNAFNLAEMKISLPYYVSSKLYVCPHAEFNVILDRDLSNSSGHYPTNYGVVLGIEF